MYGIGQRVVHPMHGAGVIESVTEELLYGAARTYYVFRQAVSGLVLKLPTDNCEAIGVRLLYDRERMDAVLSAIPSLTVEEERNWNRRYWENMARLKSGDLTGGQVPDAAGGGAGTVHRREKNAAQCQGDTAVGAGDGAGDRIPRGGASAGWRGDDGSV